MAVRCWCALDDSLDCLGLAANSAATGGVGSVFDFVFAVGRNVQDACCFPCAS